MKTELIYMALIIFISLPIGYIITRLIQTQLRSIKHRRLWLLVILVLSTVLFGITLYYISQTSRFNSEARLKMYNTEAEISEMQQKMKELEKSELLKVQEEQAKKKKVTSAIQEYFDASDSRDTLRYNALFVFPIKKFFLLKDVSREKANERIRFHWRHHPNSNFKVSGENMQIEWYSKDSVKVLVNLGEVKGTDRIVMTRIKLDSNFKIYYINNYISRPDSTDIYLP
jgi:hypothetical protein